jgi:signal transduction histidine kinase
VDWRIFENPFLNLEDIYIPVEEFEDPGAFPKLLEGMQEALIDNVWGQSSIEDRQGRNQRVKTAWKTYDETDRRLHPDAKESPSTAVARSALTASVGPRHLRQWSVWRGEHEHGMALFVLGANYELAVWNRPVAVERDESTQIRNLLKTTLTGFVDPYFSQSIPSDSRGKDFQYRIVNHIEHHEAELLSADEYFGFDDLLSLEHFIVGNFDEHGIFTGRVRAFGEDFENVRFVPSEPPPLTDPGHVGPFSFCVGTFEQEAIKSTHPAEQHQALKAKAEQYGGLAIYRDGIRVMPYGRPDSDYFGMEERRSLHAGRWFWSHRRSFGRVAVSRGENHNLRDKAGREGLIDNRARRELRNLVVNLLRWTAQKYFGSDSNIRNRHVPEIKARNELARAAEEKAGKRRSTVFGQALRANTAPLDAALLNAQVVGDALKQIVEARAVSDLPEMDDRVNDLLATKTELRLPPRPAKLGKLEDTYRDYRERYNSLVSTISTIRERWSAAVEALGTRDPEDAARTALARHQKFLNDKIRSWHEKLKDLLAREHSRYAFEVDRDRARYYAEASPLLEKLREGELRVGEVLIGLETIRENLYAELAAHYGSYQRALEQLSDKIDIDAALVWSSERRAELEKRVEQLYALAQLGITVEIIHHELNELDSEVEKGLRRLPKQVQEHDEYQRALSAHHALMERLRFLAPLKLSGNRLKEEITGREIYVHLKYFFDLQIKARLVQFSATPAFRELKLTEHRARIYPVFTNLVNNALYWVARSQNREICLDFRDGAVIVADSGPGVDPDDLEHLFELFFTKRVEGRGVGLYLCRVNLEMGNHRIEYALEENLRVLNGANFCIYFSGLKNG